MNLLRDAFRNETFKGVVPKVKSSLWDGFKSDHPRDGFKDETLPWRQFQSESFPAGGFIS